MRLHLQVRADLIIVLVFIAGGISLASTDVLGATPAEGAEGAEADGGSDEYASGSSNATALEAEAFVGGSPDARRALAELAANHLRRPLRWLAGSVVAGVLGDDSGGGGGNGSSAMHPPSSRPLPSGGDEAGEGDERSDLIGALLVLGASMCAGFRWACTQVLMAP